VTGAFRVAVIGGGAAGLMAAEVLSRAGPEILEVTVYERMPSLGRKFLMAGRGGLNLTHSEDLTRFLSRYGSCEAILGPALQALPPSAIRSWCEGLGQPTFVGSSGRVFPLAMKTSPLLRAWLQRLNDRGVVFKTRYHWQGWNAAGQLQFAASEGPVAINANATVLALGGATWPRLGSDAGWVETLENAGISVAPLAPANGGFCVTWSDLFRTRFEGQPLKRIAIRFGEHTARGEAVVTTYGIEGGAIYALSAPLRMAVATGGWARIMIDLRPDVAVHDLVRQLDVPRRKHSLSSFLRKTAKLSVAAIGLLQEAALQISCRLSTLHPPALAQLIKAVPVCLTATTSLERAISTAGGVRFDEIDAGFMLLRRPGVFVAGEMLDWEAPTGGYLLQACFATGAAAGRGVVARLGIQVKAPD
jgi:uncharacterized flavoprotein (TIGR03862 family)